MHRHDAHGPGGLRAGTTTDDRRRLAIVLVITLVYMGAEIVGGLLTGSLALLADAGHMFSDAAALGMALGAAWLAQRPPDQARTYGYYRVEILAAVANAATLIAVAGGIVWEAAKRLTHPVDVAGAAMMAVATGGLVVNLAGLWILRGSHGDSLNIRGAALHVMGDLLGSIAAIVAGAAIALAGWRWADPVASALIALLVVRSGWRLLRESLGVLMEGAPAHVDVDEVRAAILAVDGVRDVHDLHVWTITSGLDCLSAHVVVDTKCTPQTMLHRIATLLREKFGLKHTTLQVETEVVEATDQRHACW